MDEKIDVLMRHVNQLTLAFNALAARPVENPEHSRDESDHAEHKASDDNLGAGKWGIMFRALIAVGAFALPSVIALNVWLVNGQFNLENSVIRLGDKVDHLNSSIYTIRDARADNLELRNEIMNEVKSSYPPQWLRDTIESQGKRIEALENRD